MKLKIPIKQSLVVKNTKKMGRGVFATKNFKIGEVVEISPCITWDLNDQILLQDTSLRFYVFGDGGRGSCLALGLGSLFNHGGKNHNIGYKYDKKTNRMFFVTTKPIKKGHQLLIDYGYDPEVKFLEWKRKQDEKEEIEKMQLEIKESNIKLETNENIPGFWDEEDTSITYWKRFMRFLNVKKL